jgi:hypothetical protein
MPLRCSRVRLSVSYGVVARCATPASPTSPCSGQSATRASSFQSVGAVELGAHSCSDNRMEQSHELVAAFCSWARSDSDITSTAARMSRGWPLGRRGISIRAGGAPVYGFSSGAPFRSHQLSCIRR